MKDKMYGELSNVFNKTYSTTKESRSNIVGVLRDFSPLPANMTHSLLMYYKEKQQLLKNH